MKIYIVVGHAIDDWIIHHGAYSERMKAEQIRYKLQVRDAEVCSWTVE